MTAAFLFHRATPAGEGGVAIFELYGAGAADAARAAFRPRRKNVPGSGEARLGDIADPSGELIDEALASWVPAAASWSRMEAWTLAVHGGTWIQGRIESLLKDLGGEEARTRDVLHAAVRAGAMDAVEAAAYELLIEARTEKASRFFLRQYTGELSGRLREGLAFCDAGDLSSACLLLESLSAGSRPALRIGHPLRILIAGRPNAGKSTLFNALLAEERSVVAPLPGTTRDAIEESAQIHGFPVVLTDSAGIRPLELAGPVERAGIEKVHTRDDDAVLYLVPPPWRLHAEDELFLSRLAPERRLVVATFADREGSSARHAADRLVSAVTGEGMEGLRRAIVNRWMGCARDLESSEIPCAPFTPAQAAILSRTGQAERAGLDAIRSAFLECLAASWPAATDGRARAALP